MPVLGRYKIFVAGPGRRLPDHLQYVQVERREAPNSHRGRTLWCIVNTGLYRRIYRNLRGHLPYVPGGRPEAPIISPWQNLIPLKSCRKYSWQTTGGTGDPCRRRLHSSPLSHSSSTRMWASCKACPPLQLVRRTASLFLVCTR